MSDLRTVAAQVATCLAKAAGAGPSLQQAQQALEEALVAMQQALAGATGPEVSAAVGGLQEAMANLVQLPSTIDAATGVLKSYASTTLDTTPEPPATPTQQATTPASAAQPPQPGPDADTVERLRSELPPPVTPGRREPGQPAQKTHGRWVDETGQEHEMVSGHDEAYEKTVEYFREIGSRHVPQRAGDVEMKTAVEMRNSGITDATLVINNTPCVGPMSCDALVPVILPEGSTMTVHGPGGFKKRYQGGGTSSWVP